jgi:hypothetical protein
MMWKHSSVLPDLDRRSFVKTSLLPAAWLVPLAGPARPSPATDLLAESGSTAPAITDTNVHLFSTQGGVGRLIDGTHTSYREVVPVERLLFGSHAPFFPCESALLKLFESPLNLPQLELLMHANARKLLG